MNTRWKRLIALVPVLALFACAQAAWCLQDVTAQSNETEFAVARAACASNVRQIAGAIRSYAQDHDGRLPRAATWQNEIRPYLQGVDPFRCPSDLGQGASSYSYNWMVAGLRVVDITDPSATVLVFESEFATANQSDSAATIPRIPRHQTGNHYAFVDGHVELLAKPPNFLPTYAGVPARAADHKEQLRQLQAMNDTLGKKLDETVMLSQEEAAGIDYYQVRQSLERAVLNMDEAYNRLAIVNFQRVQNAPEGLSQVMQSSAGKMRVGDGSTSKDAVGIAQSKYITMEVENQRFVDVLMRLARDTGNNIVLSPDGVPEGTVYCLLQQVTFEEALARLCEAVGAEYTVGLTPVSGSQPVYVVRAAVSRETAKDGGKGIPAGGEIAENVQMLGAVVPATAPKPSEKSSRAVSTTVLDFAEADFREVVGKLAKRYGFTYEIASDVPDGKTVTLSSPVRVSGVDAAIQTVADASATVWTRNTDGSYTISMKQ